MDLSPPSSVDILDWTIHLKAIPARLEKLETENSLLHSSIHDLTDRVEEVEFENQSLKQLVTEMNCQENVHPQNLHGDIFTLQLEISNLKTLQEERRSQQALIK